MTRRDTMDATVLLETQHRSVEDLFEQIEATEEHDEKLALCNELADLFAAHASIEEKLFYPLVYKDELADQLAEAVEEHLSAKRIVADILQMKPGDTGFDAKVMVLKEQIEHHVEEEEGELFESVRESMSAAELETLGAQMEALFEELMQGTPRRNIPDETGEAAPLPSS
jgi:non-homologous end joining protein Ku